MAEAQACFKVVSFKEELGFRDVCVEGDALTGIGTLIKDIKQRITNFKSFQARFIPRGLTRRHMGW